MTAPYDVPDRWPGYRRDEAGVAERGYTFTLRSRLVAIKIVSTSFRHSPQSPQGVTGCDTPHRELDARNRLVARRVRS